MSNKREIGNYYEKIAQQYLIEQGLQILEMNYFTSKGEIDIIAVHKGYLVFLEVKYRGSHQMGFPEDAIDMRKQKKICVVADWYRLQHKIADTVPVRYDVICIFKTEITWYQNAFEHHYRHK